MVITEPLVLFRIHGRLDGCSWSSCSRSFLVNLLWEGISVWRLHWPESCRYHYSKSKTTFLSDPKTNILLVSQKDPIRAANWPIKSSSGPFSCWPEIQYSRLSLECSMNDAKTIKEYLDKVRFIWDLSREKINNKYWGGELPRNEK